MVQLSLLLAAAAASTSPDREASLLGFFTESRSAQARVEALVTEAPSAQKLQAWLQRLTEEPHVAGTPQEQRLAEWVAARFTEFGLETETRRYDAFLNHPSSVSLKLVEPVQAELSLVEPPVPGDKDSTAHGMFPGFHGYGASGAAEGQVIYANYGTPADFKRLEALGVEVAGRIVLVRYGRVFRGLKVKQAEDRGARGVIIYSDPADDGYAKGDVYPDGPMRPPGALQRGSVQFLSLGPGDPSTPGWASLPGAKRVPRAQMTGLPKIPSLPISYGEAEKLLRHLGGPRVPDEWQGGLPFAYHVGPGAAAVAMDVRMDEGLKPIFNVFARIRGSVEPESLVIFGNHRDAWTHGAVDPNSGTAVQIELARTLGLALKSGWRPRRTLVLASWDGEEYGLVGSTEWVEDQAATLGAHALAYINTDALVSGPELRLGGVPSLRDLVMQVADALPEPRQGGTLRAAWERRERDEWAQSEPVPLDGPDASFEAALSPLGSGSDYTAFLDHIGVPALDLAFTGPYGVYHSVLDNFRWMATQGDPGFVYHATATRLLALLATRLTSAEVAPLRFGSYAATLRAQLASLRRDARRRARSAGGTNASAPIDPDFGPTLAALGRLERAGAAADQSADRIVATADSARAGQMNAALGQLERAFLREGLPRRPWFKHVLTAPGTTTGYAAWPFPGLAQGIEDRDTALFASEQQQLVAALDEATRRLEAAAALAPAKP